MITLILEYGVRMIAKLLEFKFFDNMQATIAVYALGAIGIYLSYLLLLSALRRYWGAVMAVLATYSTFISLMYFNII